MQVNHGNVTVGDLLIPLILCLVLFSAVLHADDWPQWRGIDRLGVWAEDDIIERFPADGLKVKWRVPISGGFSGPVVADGRVFVTDFALLSETRVMDGTERILALDEHTGELLWTHDWPAPYRNLMASYATGPRASPAVEGNRVYAVGAAGMILCLDAGTGEVLWQIDATAKYGTTVPVWGVSGSPLVDGDRVIYIVGGEPDALVMAFDKMTGEEVWRSLPVVSEMGYAQPVIYHAGGVRQLIIWHPTAVSSLNPETGEVYWEQPWDVRNGLTVATPAKSENYLFFTQHFGGSMMLRFNPDRPGATVLWQSSSTSDLPDETESLHSLITTPIIEGDYIYGVGSYGELRALDALTGERLWVSGEMTAQRRFSAAFMVRHGDKYFVNNDEGFLLIARFTPAGYVEIDRTTLINTTLDRGYGPKRLRLVNWTHPAYANGHIITRNDHEIIRISLTTDDY